MVEALRAANLLVSFVPSNLQQLYPKKHNGKQASRIFRNPFRIQTVKIMIVSLKFPKVYSRYTSVSGAAI